MNQINLFIELTRLKKPIGFMLLFWPCSWGLTLAYDFSESLNDYFYYLFLFLMKSKDLSKVILIEMDYHLIKDT